MAACQQGLKVVLIQLTGEGEPVSLVLLGVCNIVALTHGYLGKERGGK